MTKNLKKFKEAVENQLSAIFRVTCKECGGDVNKCIGVISIGDLPVNATFTDYVYEEDVKDSIYKSLSNTYVTFEKTSNNEIRILNTDFIVRSFRNTNMIKYCKNTTKY